MSTTEDTFLAKGLFRPLDGLSRLTIRPSSLPAPSERLRIASAALTVAGARPKSPASARRIPSSALRVESPGLVTGPSFLRPPPSALRTPLDPLSNRCPALRSVPLCLWAECEVLRAASAFRRFCFSHLTMAFLALRTLSSALKSTS